MSDSIHVIILYFLHIRYFSGSYYEKLKVGQPNEFDFMVQLDIEPTAIELEYERNAKLEGYVKVKIIHGITTLAKFATDDHKYLSPVKLKQTFLQILKDVTRSQGNVEVEEHGPAVQLTFKSGSEIIAEVDVVLCIAFPKTWPQHAIVEAKGLSSNVLEKIKSKGFHIVPKTTEHEMLHWRVSYSLSEKELLLHHMKGEDHKKVLKFVKFLRETHEHQLPGMHSYHLKNVFLEQSLVYKKSLAWDKDHFLERVIDILREVLEALKQGELRHFFNSRCNLLINVSQEERTKCISTIEQILTKLRSNDIEKICSII